MALIVGRPQGGAGGSFYNLQHETLDTTDSKTVIARKFLVTGAAGKTGQAVLAALQRQGRALRALVRQETQREMFGGGNIEVQVGDLRRDEDVRRAMDGVQAVYLICPNMCADELDLARRVLHWATAAGVEHLVYHSVLHPQAEAMPHHGQKLRVEEALFQSSLSWTILQPSAYLQNALTAWKTIVDEGIYAVPYGDGARLTMVDLDDVARVAAEVLGDPAHYGALYELAGPQTLNPAEAADILGRCLGRPVKARHIDLDTWQRRAEEAGLEDPYALTTLRAMFSYYERYGLVGNGKVLSWLLGRPSADLESVVRRYMEPSSTEKTGRFRLS